MGGWRSFSEVCSCSEVAQRHGADLPRLPGEQPAVVVYLAEVIGEVADEVQQEVSGRYGEPARRLGIGLAQRRVGETRHAALHRPERGVDLAQQLHPRDVAL